MDDNEKTLAVFAKTNIEGLDLDNGVLRFGGNPKLYVKIIKTFVDNIGTHLDTLMNMLKPEAIESYGIEVHGIKGSCYGISANREGDMAKELEMAAKAGDFDKISAGNGPFIDAVNELKANLQAMVDEIEGGASNVQKKAEPDKALLASMLQASRDFDVDKMQEALKELEQYDYESGGDLVKWLSEQVTAFGYDKIEEKLASIL